MTGKCIGTPTEQTALSGSILLLYNREPVESYTYCGLVYFVSLKGSQGGHNKIQDLHNRRTFVVHFDRLKPYLSLPTETMQEELGGNRRGHLIRSTANVLSHYALAIT